MAVVERLFATLSLTLVSLLVGAEDSFLFSFEVVSGVGEARVMVRRQVLLLLVPILG